MTEKLAPTLRTLIEGFYLLTSVTASKRNGITSSNVKDLISVLCIQ